MSIARSLDAGGPVPGARPAPYRLLALLVAGLLMAAPVPVAAAKSLYVIADMYGNPSVPIQEYNIGSGGGLTLRAEYAVPYRNLGAVGLALDPKAQRLFVTFEGSNVITVLDLTTKQTGNSATAKGATNLAGIVYDQSKELLYCMDRGTATLYVFQWDPAQKGLVPTPGSPFHLSSAQAFGIALDETKGELYVGSATKTVRVYSTSDWHALRTIATGDIAISVAVDSVRGYLYFGGSYPDAENAYLTQRNLANNAERRQLINSNAVVMGLGVDLDTGFVFLSTGVNGAPGGDQVWVYNASLSPLASTDDIGNPTGLVVPNVSVSYNALPLTKTIVMPAAATAKAGADRPSVTIGEEITYALSFDQDDQPLTDVSVVDKLPAEIAFVRATGDGVYGHYDAGTHRYTWLNPPRTTGRTIRLELVGRVEPNTPADRAFTNSATLSAYRRPSTTATATAITAAPKTYKPLHLVKTVMAAAAGGSGTTLASAHAGDELTYRITFDNRDNNFPAKNVRLLDNLPPQVDFVRASDDGLFGRYDPNAHTYTWIYPQLASGESNTVDLVVRLDAKVAGGTRITNSAMIESDSTPLARTTVDVMVTDYAPLRLQKTLVRGALDQPDARGRPQVEVGATLTYMITFSNPSTNWTATEVSVVDTLPREVRFVSADGDRDFGRYDPNTHTYTWRYSALEPGREQHVNLVVRIDENTRLGTAISNTASITARQAPRTTTSVDVVVVAARTHQPLRVVKTVLGSAGGDSRTPVSVTAGAEVTYRIIFDTRDNPTPLANVRLTDQLPQEATFVRATGDREFGRYDPVTHTYTWSYAQLAPNETYFVDLVVRFDAKMAGGATIANTVTAVSEGTPVVTARVEVTVVNPRYPALLLRKALVSGGTGQQDREGRPYVNAGGVLMYTLSFSNPPTNKTVTQVSLVDTLPREVSFVRADGDRDFGSYDPATHTYTWRYPSVAPGAEQSVNLVVQVNEKTDPNTVISNSASIVSPEAATTTVHTDVVVRAAPIAVVQGQMYFKPDHLYRNSTTTKEDLMVVVHLPEGIGKDEISDAALVLTPGNVLATGQVIFGTSTQGKVLCFFAVDPILAATQGYGQFPLTVTGQLRDGRSFACERAIWILKFGGP